MGPSLRADVAGVEIPPIEASAGEIWTALDGQTGRLDQANDSRRAVLEVIERCEARDREATSPRGLWARLLAHP